MLRSLYSSVSGLKNHQLKMDVLGNNIANVNTLGFKGSRINFSEALNQLVSNSHMSPDGGYLDPMQIGLGMKATSMDTRFNQGAIESTGNMTDMAIDGDGFFVLRNGDQNVYSRVGTFYFNSDGKLVNHSGLSVQGWMLNDTTDASNLGSNNISDITVDQNSISDAIATQNVFLSGNLNASLKPEAEVWSSGNEYFTRATVDGGAIAGAVNVVAGTNDQFVVEVQTGSSTPTSATLTLSAGNYATVDDLVAEINTQIAGNINLNGRIEAINNGGAIRFRSLENNPDTNITLRSGTNDVLADLQIANGAAGSSASATETTALDDLFQTTTSLVSGDTIAISGTNPDGTPVNNTFTYGAANDGTTLGDLINTINSSYTGVTASLQDGKVVLTDNVVGDSQTTISLNAGGSNVGEIVLSGFLNTTPGFTGKATSSMVVYDSQGGSHSLVVEFIKSENSNEWAWNVVTSGDEQVLGGGSGRATFNEAGALTSFTTSDGISALQIDPGNGAENMSITLHAEGDENHAGLSQFNSVSNLLVRDQDGRAVGSLVGLSIAKDGTVTGTYSNGEIVDLAKIALAKVSNNNGLVNEGDGLYGSSISSGDVNIFSAGSDDQTSILSGALEMSNVDLAQEFTDMITTQRGFQANAKVISTVDQLMNDLIQLKR